MTDYHNRWTPTEDTVLLEKYAHVRIIDIVDILDDMGYTRTKDAVRHRAKLLGISCVQQPHKSPRYEGHSTPEYDETEMLAICRRWI